MGNARIEAAKAGKKDEFYTCREDIEKEMDAYLAHDPDAFRGLSVICPCDRVDSEFTRYFADNFAKLGMKRLVSTSWKPGGKGRIVTMERDFESVEDLQGDGDFLGGEVQSLIRDSDAVVTNPPFSLFRPFLKTIAGKKIAIIGTLISAGYKDVFPLMQGGRVKFGASVHSGDVKFKVPGDYPLKSHTCFENADGRFIRVPGVRWLTTFAYDDVRKASPLKTLEENIEAGVAYRAYDNCNGIDVPSSRDIPSDYGGLMGVPLTFLDRPDSGDFELVRLRKGDDGKDLMIDGRCVFTRILIRRRKSDA